MIRQWLQSLQTAASPETEDPAVCEVSCPGMARAVERILRAREQPQVLDLGQVSGSAAVYLADRGARVCVEDFRPPDADATPESVGPDGPPAAAPPLVIRQPDDKFDLVLAWEHGDFVPPNRLQEFAAEVRRVLAPGGWLLLFAQDRAASEAVRHDRPGSYRFTADDRAVRSPAPGPTRPRWVYPNRAIEQALAPLSVQGIHLQRNRMREILAHKSED